MADVPSTWLTLDEAAAYTKLSPATLLRSVKAGELRAFKVRGRKLWRFRTVDLDGWLGAHAIEG